MQSLVEVEFREITITPDKIVEQNVILNMRLKTYKFDSFAIMSRRICGLPSMEKNRPLWNLVEYKFAVAFMLKEVLVGHLLKKTRKFY